MDPESSIERPFGELAQALGLDPVRALQHLQAQASRQTSLLGPLSDTDLETIGRLTTSILVESTSVPNLEDPESRASIDFGRYIGAKEFARGGMGILFHAEDPDLRRPVAIKFLRPTRASDRDYLERFLREARITGQLEHPNIPPVHELGRTDRGHFYMTMKYVDGVTLAETLADLRAGMGTEDLETARRRLLMAFLRALDAVSYAHSRGVIHGDLKPENIMIGRFGEVLVLDWPST